MPTFQAISLPDFNVDEIGGVLERTIADLEAAAAERVQTHIAKLGRGGEAWVSEGMTRIEPVSQDLAGEVCPFCTQDIGDQDLIAHYRVYFSQAYKDLKTGIRQVGEAVRNNHAGDIPSAFERKVRAAVQTREFWKDFAKLPVIDIDTAAIARQWYAARKSVLEQIRAKAAAPLEPTAVAPETRQAIQDYRECIADVAALSERLVCSNVRLDNVKEQAAVDDLASLGR